MDAYSDLKLVLANKADLITLSEKYNIFRLVEEFDLKRKVINGIIDYLTRFLFCVTCDFELMKLAYDAYYVLTTQQKFFSLRKPLVTLLLGNPGNFSMEANSINMFHELKKIKFDDDIYTPNWMYLSLTSIYFSCRHCNKMFLYWCCCMRAIKQNKPRPIYCITSFCDPGDVTHWRPCFTSHVE